ncbi:MAG: FHA domain-containing protein [Anaerolineae bacterium]|nr:FHA domain-containing protein [Anaerolineae bacterium]MDW8173600.1 FHA domain-containing protein [Anaerolineae bacterium]
MSDRVRLNVEIQVLGKSFDLDANPQRTVGDLLREIGQEFAEDFARAGQQPLGELWASGTFRPLNADLSLGQIGRTSLVFGPQAPRPDEFDLAENDLMVRSDSLPPNHQVLLRSGSGERYPLTMTPTILGREGNLDPRWRARRLEVANRSSNQVSRLHCAILLRRNVYYLVHLSEQSTTYHNDRPLTQWRAVPLEDRDVIRLGNLNPPLEFTFRMREI